MDINTKIYAENIDKRIQTNIACNYTELPELYENDVIIYHFATGSDIMENILQKSKCRKIMIYHNITPSVFFKKYDENVANIVEHGRSYIKAAIDIFECCIADSEYNKKELIEAGYTCPIYVLPILIPLSDYEKAPDVDVLNNYNDDWINFLFVGRIAPNKKQEDIIAAFAYYKKHFNLKSRLFIVGSQFNVPYYQCLQLYVQKLQVKDVIFTGHTPFNHILAYYKLADAFLCMSEHEGFCVPLVEAMKLEVPIIAYDATAIAETLGEAGIVVKSKNPVSVSAIMDKLCRNTKLHDDLIAKERQRIKYFGYENISNKTEMVLRRIIYRENDIHSQSVPNYNQSKKLLEQIISENKDNYKNKEFEKIVDSYLNSNKNSLKHKIKIKVLKPVYLQLMKYSPTLAITIKNNIYRLKGTIYKSKEPLFLHQADDKRPSGILVDLSEITELNQETGIQRVVENVFKELLHLNKTVIPIRICDGKLITSYKFLSKIKGEPFNGDEWEITMQNGDILFLLDSSWRFYRDVDEIIDEAHNKNARVYTVIYDLIPMQYAQFVVSNEFRKIFENWYNVVAKKCDCILCISKTTADLVEKYYLKQHCVRNHPLKLYSFTMGFNIKSYQQEKRESIIKFIKEDPCFLMVGTVEPRKGHMIVIDSFKKTLKKHKNIKLLIIGHNGWKNDEIKNKLQDDDLANNVLWIEDANDGELAWAYKHSCAIISASQDEGYGLPLIEAAYYGVPIICSDIPIFHEVTEDNATFFKAMDVSALTDTLEQWLKTDVHPDSKKIRLFSWQESAQDILDIFNGKVNPYKTLN